ncbi:uncharacterized protein LOC131208223 [Anopheles bellator]|uniref:uncharacterized protein LOC131208223 n=1 Tax=Anopheles bellator TaxID=139047 RepID=UPI002648649D|nr:uncharacterized protein LOC131208223 [Anopheles bellator]
MAYLAPQKAYWRRKDSHDLQNMFNELGTLDAFVMDVDQTSASLDVILFSSNDYNVNREFAALSEGKWLGENFAGQNDAAYRQRLKTFNEQYPSFTDIEEGRYPTVAELERALLREFDFEHHYTKTAHGQRALTVVKEFKLSPRRFALNTLPLSNPFRELFE